MTWDQSRDLGMHKKADTIIQPKFTRACPQCNCTWYSSAPQPNTAERIYWCKCCGQQRVEG